MKEKFSLNTIIQKFRGGVEKDRLFKFNRRKLLNANMQLCTVNGLKIQKVGISFIVISGSND